MSNFEAKVNGTGGVGAITFDAQGQVVNYEMVLDKTTMNCGGGKTPWNTWVSCEEWGRDGDSHGNIYQVDPTGKRPPEKLTLGREGGKWESFAYDIRDLQTPYFFVTVDVKDGALQRFQPDQINWENPWDMLHGAGATVYLVLNPDSTGDTGTFAWSKDKSEAQANAKANYPNTEGIDVHDGILFFVCKDIKMIFELDLDNFTYKRKSTAAGLFDGQPDQLKRILSNNGTTANVNGDDFLFFTEEGGTYAGVHGRDEQGRYFTLLESPHYDDETTGLAFNPQHTHMYIAYQDTGMLFDVSRLDGQPFHAMSIDVKYHNQLIHRVL